MSCEDCLSRREFLTRGTLAVAGAAALAAGCGDGQFGPTAIVSRVTTVSLQVGSVPGLATVGQCVRVPQDGVYINVKRTAAAPAAFVAFSSICTHEQCDTAIQGNAIVCPCHDTHYDSDGHVTKQPNGGGSATNLPGYATRYDAATDTLTIG
ncbi:MAG: Rieske 2Fe-2S domain-containing protein [bacterium]